MRSIKLSWSCILFFLLLISCKSGDDKSETPGAVNIENAIAEAEARRGADPAASGGNTCLLAYQEKYDQLIGEQEVLDVTGFRADVMETKYNKVMKPEYHSFDMKFKNKRKGKVRGLDIVMELPDVVSVGAIKSMSLNQFKDSYRVVSDEEMQAARDALNDMADGKSSDPEAAAALDAAEKQNVSKETVKKVGGGVLDVIKEVGKANTVVEGVGDAAVWNTVSNELYVLQNGVKFQVRAEVSEDTGKNKAIAMEIARRILKKCS